MPNTGQRTLDNWASPSRGHHTQHTSSSGQTGSMPGKRPRDGQTFDQRANLAAVARETKAKLPDILKELPNIQAAKSEALYLNSLPPLQASDCPRRTPSGKTMIKIVNDDSFNAAIDLAASKYPASPGRVAVLNMASHANPGGGWLKGAKAQEEALCYRSSLSLSLDRRHYPFKQLMGLYSPDVVVIRSDMASGHKLLMPGFLVEDLPVVSVLSIAALRCPKTNRVRFNTPDGQVHEKLVYANPSDRGLTKAKMRLCLRMAAQRNHGLLVLGALGCGAFKNPKEEVAQCWLEVLREQEFQGGWWEEIWFAVFDTRREGNFEVFEDILGGQEV
ncbi:mitochondrial chaperone BCS1 [Pochonia chlamydosporia 170]|uniref:Mitochondrial chaperone BCS1 n=1 Tax=Pochonia chlamydosporia 170 TaxID=1380566 RepID=A0A179FF30_METCM|nr:mitochondrial chaperone BCS1 [Pochonia chlamydosporia 170]OAQ64122.1 mitochondrial chaperone BCS1 [Pochonia chlamydosporia 170]